MLNQNELVNNLNEYQKKVYEYVESGLSVEDIAKLMDVYESSVKAQITRITNKGIIFNRPVSSNNEQQNSEQQSPQNQEVNPHNLSNTQILEEAVASGEAKTLEEVVRELEKAGPILSGKEDVNVFLAFGVTMQFIRFAGGKINAHQLIEDISEAVKMTCGEVSSHYE